VTALSKLDQIRALRERRFAERAAPVSSVELLYGGAPGGMVATVNNTKQPLLTSSAERQSKWRKANPDINRQRAREGMRKLRAGSNA
jgi:hypothetical protein